MTQEPKLPAVRPLALVCLLALSAPALAWEVEVRVGLEGVLQEEGWAPLRVRCQAAPDDPPLSGVVVVDLGREAVAGCAAPIHLAPGEAALIHMAVPVGPGRNYEARLVDARGRTVATSPPEVALALLDAEESLGLLVGGDGLAALRAAAVQKGAPRLVHVEAEGLRHLPDCVLDGMAAVILVPEAGGALREVARDRQQVERLRGFVERGGTLVVLAGSGSPFWEDSPLLELLPVRQHEGLIDVHRSVFEALLGPLGVDDRRVRTIPALAVVPRQAERLIPGTDLLLRRRLGRGRVLFLAFDPDLPALRGAVRAGPFLTQLVPPRPPEPARLRDDALEGLSRRAFQGVGTVGTTGVSLMALALVAQLLLVGPVALLLGRRRGPWVAFLAPGLFSLLVAGALLVGGALTRGEPAARALVWSFRDQSGTAQDRVSLGLFAGGGEEFSLALPAGLVPAPGPRRDLTLLQFRAAPPRLRCEEGHPVAIEPLRVPARGLAHLELRGPADPEPAPFRAQLAAPLDPGQGGLELVELEALAPLEGLSALVIGPREARLGRLPGLAPGERWTFDPAQAMALPEARDGWEGDLWRDEAGTEESVLLAVAGQLQAERARAAASAPTGLAPSFPSAWLLRVDASQAPLAVSRGEDGVPLPVATRRVTVWAVGAGR